MRKIWISDGAVVLTAVICAILLALKGDAHALVTCLLTVVCVAAVHITFHCSRFSIPYFLYNLILIFIVLAMVLGKMWNFYGRIPEWDFGLHLVSGIMLASIGKLFCRHLIRQTGKEHRKLLYWFVFLFSSAAAGLWEVFEFLGDVLFHMQAQGGSLWDTMTDIIAGNIGCILFLCYTAFRSK